MRLMRFNEKYHQLPFTSAPFFNVVYFFHKWHFIGRTGQYWRVIRFLKNPNPFFWTGQESIKNQSHSQSINQSIPQSISILVSVIMLSSFCVSYRLLIYSNPLWTTHLPISFHCCQAITVSPDLTIRKDCFQNKSKFITEDHLTKHMNITIN